MRSISEWFDRHPKTRIALQLVLDGLPFFVALAVIAPFTGILNGLSDYRAIYLFWGMCLNGFLYANIPLFVFACWLRHRAKAKFERYPWCKILSLILRVLSLFAVVLCVAFWIWELL